MTSKILPTLVCNVTGYLDETLISKCGSQSLYPWTGNTRAHGVEQDTLLIHNKKIARNNCAHSNMPSGMAVVGSCNGLPGKSLGNTYAKGDRGYEKVPDEVERMNMYENYRFAGISSTTENTGTAGAGSGIAIQISGTRSIVASGEVSAGDHVSWAFPDPNTADKTGGPIRLEARKSDVSNYARDMNVCFSYLVSSDRRMQDAIDEKKPSEWQKAALTLVDAQVTNLLSAVDILFKLGLLQVPSYFSDSDQRDRLLRDPDSSEIPGWKPLLQLIASEYEKYAQRLDTAGKDGVTLRQIENIVYLLMVEMVLRPGSDRRLGWDEEVRGRILSGQARSTVFHAMFPPAGSAVSTDISALSIDNVDYHVPLRMGFYTNESGFGSESALLVRDVTDDLSKNRFFDAKDGADINTGILRGVQSFRKRQRNQVADIIKTSWHAVRGFDSRIIGKSLTSCGPAGGQIDVVLLNK